MRGLNLVKTCTILGALFGLVYWIIIALAPVKPVAKTRMFIPKEMIPKLPSDLPPGTQPPLAVRLKWIAIGSLFLVPFGGMAGLGIGLLLDGARRTWRGSQGGEKPQG